MKYFWLVFIFLVTSIYTEIFVFTPPNGWKLLKPQGNPQCILFTYVSPEMNYPPSLTLAHEPLRCSQKQYLAAAQKLLSRSAKTCRKLGEKNTPAGKGILFQTESSTVHGNFSTLVVIFFSQEEVYTLSFASTKQSFAEQYPDFERTIMSAQITPSIYTLISNAQQQKIKEQKELFQKNIPSNTDFQSLVQQISQDKKLQALFANFEIAIAKIIGKEHQVHTYYLMKDFVSELTKFSEQKNTQVSNDLKKA